MKKSLKFFTASMIAVSTTTLTHSQSFFNQEDARAYRANINARIEELNEKAKTDDNALKDLLRLGFNLSISNGGSFIENMRKSKEIEKELVKTDEDKKNIDRQIKVVEMMVQEGISDFMKNEKNDFSGMDITIGIIMLGVDSNYDIIPLLKECFQIKNDLLSHNALANYIKIKGAEALPFLHELLEAANLSNESRATIFKELVQCKS